MNHIGTTVRVHYLIGST